MLRYLSFIILFDNLLICHTDHYKGGTLTWRPVNPASLSSPVQLIITARQSWTLSRYPCNSSNVNVIGAYNDTNNITSSSITCISSSASCTSAGFQNISLPFRCTDFSPISDVSTGVFTSRQNYTLNSIIDLAWRGASWSTDTLTNSWSMISRMDLTPIAGRINSPPVTASLPVVQIDVNQLTAIQIQVSDWDPDQVVRCRWSYQLPDDECGNVCFNLPNASLSSQDCAITWKASLRPEDIAAGRNSSTYVIAITAEDFTNASSMIPLSATPHQMIVRVSTPPNDDCSVARPAIIGAPRRNQACFGWSVGSTWTFTITGRVYCLNDTIVEFVTSSPPNMNKTNITQASNYTFVMGFTWTPNADQIGIQPFCVAVVDNHGVWSNPFCFSMAVGGSTPGYISPTIVQGSISPVGTVLATHTRFSIRANMPLKRTIKNGTYIRIYNSSGSQVRAIDTKYSPDVFFLNTTLIFYVRNPPWVLGVSYFVNLDQGVLTANNTCGTESGGLGGWGTWVFTVWNPAMSSTTTPPTTTTTAPTVGTVTTRPIATTSPNTLLTTTGISSVTIRTTTTTSSTSSVTTTTTTTGTTTTTTTTSTTESIPNAVVIYPKDMEQTCLQPVTVATVIITVTMIPLHLYAMINLFVKMNAHFNKELVQKRIARRHRSPTSIDNAEETETFF